MTKSFAPDRLHISAAARGYRLLAACAVAMALLPPWAAAQQPSGSPSSAAASSTVGTSLGWAPIGADAVMRAELSKTVSPAFFGDDNSWSGGQPVELRANRSRPDALVLDGSNGGQILVFLKSWLQAVRPMGTADSPTPVHESGRPSGVLAAGQKWTARLVTEQSPVDWCNDTRGQIEGDFEVGKAQTYTLTVNGQPHTLDVLPVVERGKWTRCFSGKRYTRMLYAPVLDAVVSMEFITYRTNGQPHEASFRVQVKEIVGAQAK